jgi:hypothetical protein
MYLNEKAYLVVPDESKRSILFFPNIVASPVNVIYRTKEDNEAKLSS